MKWKIFSIFFISICIQNLIYPSPFLGAPKVHFSIIYTNDVMGEVEPCG